MFEALLEVSGASQKDQQAVDAAVGCSVHV